MSDMGFDLNGLQVGDTVTSLSASGNHRFDAEEGPMKVTHFFVCVECEYTGKDGRKHIVHYPPSLLEKADALKRLHQRRPS